MGYHSVAQTLKLFREQQGLSQEEFADGIMSVRHYARLENGETSVSKSTIDLLFNRLGMVAKRFFPYHLSNEELNVYMLRDEFDDCLAVEDDERMAAIFAEMEKQKMFKKGLHKQFLLKAKAALYNKRDNDYAAAKTVLQDAIKITIPMFEYSFVDKYLLGSEDIEIIVMLAKAEEQEGDTDIAVIILEKLAVNINARLIDKHEKARSLILVLYNLSNILGKLERFEEALKACTEALEFSERVRVYGLIPQLIFNKAYCLFYLNRRDNLQEMLQLAYYTGLSHGQKNTAEKIEKLALSLFDISIK